MVAVKTRFDGQKIEVPAELRGAAPAEVILIYPKDTAAESAGSIFDVIGKAPEPRSASDIDAQVRQERDCWGEQ